ncbi:acetoin:2,6-dichlorophenolindophenol oxidoreductase subunit alpha [Petrotoga mexicana DSM 14811]|uniref:Pyruvate dehydrogenase E1 component subunit alpha n=1 Tax=Petrotoga mexicana DSM 14811 TaxID=1122954 RepID=A0A2K1P9H1_9BACT|nr:pyruvate dehydrogenase (acetyl-transferring) E1 component subunit alpha [Petrotoga mexicana]PNR99430.1 acetoin:2,6-dichlorophenolindophenol oxidoreductase subunit alpha [Petrotoga mexicana DSM 14811]
MDISKELVMDMYTKMLRIRRFEQRVAELFAAAKIGGFVHLYWGEEAVAVGVTANLSNDDLITSTHRGHGHLIAKGGETKYMMAELYGKETGYCKGKGGSMHIADATKGILGANGIVGAGLPIATGAALSIKLRGSNQVSVCFFGDGASNQGTFHESMNMAAIWKLPVVYICENNLYGEFTPQKDHQAITDISSRAEAYGFPGITVDGNDVFAVYEATNEAIKRARNGNGPTLIECKTYRVRGHFEGDPQLYRSKEEVEEWKRNDPIMRVERYISENGIVSEEKLKEIQKGIDKELDEAVEFAEKSKDPDEKMVAEDVYTDIVEEVRVR